VLTENSGQVVTKDELLNKVWSDSFVEESNLSRHIYVLRKTFKDLGEADLIQTVPRRGYRFTGEVHENGNGALIIEKPSSAQTLIEELDSSAEPEIKVLKPPDSRTKVSHWRLKPFVVVTALLLLIAGGIAWNKSNILPQNQSEPLAPLTLQSMQVGRLTAKGKVYDPAISPDGKFLAYIVRHTESKQSLWLRDLTGKSETQLIPPKEWLIGTTVFAPDGGSIYFWGREGAKDGAAYQIPLFGGTPRKIAENIRSGIGLSPDGKQLAYIRFDGNQHILFVCNVDGSGERIVTKRTGKFTYFTWGLAPAWSPDGTRLVVSAQELKSEEKSDAQEQYFVEVNVADGAEKRLASPQWHNCNVAAWLPAGSGLIVIAQDKSGAPYQLWHLSYPDGAALRITNDTNNYFKFSLTADGKSLAAAQEIWNNNIWILPKSDTSRARQITHVTSGAENFAVWMPDSRLIFHIKEGASQNLWLMDADGQNRQQLTFDETAHNGTPMAAPDGRSIFFTSNRTGVSHVWQMDADGRNPRQITDGDGEKMFEITSDGRWLIYAAIKHWTWTLWKKPLDVGEAVKLSEHLYEEAIASPDGKQILFGYYVKDAADGNPWRIAVMPFDGSAPPKLLDLPSPLQYFDWSADGQSVYLVKKVDSSNVWQYSLDGKLLRQVTDFPAETPGYIIHFAWSPDGKQLAITRETKISDAILISDFR
jgi:Tol biopolymer transport system component